MESATKADAIGRLAALPLSEVLVSLLERGSSGTLVLQERSGRKSALYFQSGTVVKARTPAQIPARTEPQQALILHVEWVAALPGSTVYGLYLDTDYLVDQDPIRSEPLPMIWRCARSSVDVERVERVVAALEEKPLRLHPQAKLERFGLLKHEMLAVSGLRRARPTFGELLETYHGDPAILCKLIYALAITRHLDLGEGPKPIEIPGANVRQASPPAAHREIAGRVRSTPARRPFTSSLGIQRASSGVKQRARGSDADAAVRLPARRAQARFGR